MTQGCWRVHPGPSQTAYGLATQREEEARLATPEGRAETEARNAAVLAKMRGRLKWEAENRRRAVENGADPEY